MSARSKARKRALEIIYAAEVRGRSAVEEMTEGGEVNNPWTETLVRGVDEHRERIDEVIGSHSEGWSLARMPAVDRNVLRIGVYEIVYVDEVPDAVAVSEAVNLAKELSTDDSPAFVNGVLGAVVRDKAQINR